jgi:peptidoglycan/LPS O-acetylase OafA/YrhL
MDYRREIDGLRALAVLPVILFHAGFKTFSGGFVGVDVFFVISGYLITSIIISELRRGEFSLVSFYERRARRILPSLFIVIFCSFVFAWLWLLPRDILKFSDSLAAVVLFVSNHLFSNQSGYFDTSAEFKPLLHTWSLSVEEQFYLLFPLLLVFTWRLKRTWLVAILVTIFCLSLATAQFSLLPKQSATFFLLPARAWELFIAAFVALYSSKNRPNHLNRSIAEVGGLIGLSLVTYAIFFFNSTIPFPGFYALVPTLGTALIILCVSPATLLGKVMGNRLLVGIGLVSYSAYLWHQPLFAFAKLRRLETPSQIFLTGLAFVAMLLAYVTWRFVETPFKDKTLFTRKKIFTLTASFSMSFFAIGLAGHLTDGFSHRFDNAVIKLGKPEVGEMLACDPSGKAPCLLGDSNVKPSVALLGDSHGSMLMFELAKQLQPLNISALGFTGPRCVPLIDVGTDNKTKSPHCRSLVKNNYESVLADQSIKKVVLIAQWSIYTEGYRWGDDGLTFYTDENSKTKSISENSDVVMRGFKRTIDSLKAAGKEVMLIKSIPEYDVHVPTHLAKHLHLVGKVDIGDFAIDRTKYLHRNAKLEGIVSQLEIEKNLTIVNPLDVFCGDSQCRFVENGEALYGDSNHLSNAGAKIIVPHIVSFFK